MLAEQVILSEGNVTVTPTRVIVAGDTYSLANISSVKRGTNTQARDTAIGLTALLVVGAIVAAANGGWDWFAVAGIAAGLSGATAYSIGVDHLLLFATAGTEREALKSKDAAFIGRVADAISRAMVARG